MRFKKLIVLGLLLIVSGCINSAPTKFEMGWSMRYGENKNDIAYSVYQDSGGYILSGSSNSFSNDYDVFLIRTDKDGKELWKKTFKNKGDDVAFSAFPVSDGYILFILTSEDEKKYTMEIMKINEKGDQIWKKSLENEENFHISAVDKISEGFILLGSVQGDKTDQNNIVLIKIDEDGNEIWKRSLEIRGYNLGRSIKEAPDGYVIAGTSFTSEKQDALFIKTDRDGKMEWYKKYDYSDKDWLQDLLIVSDGYILLGYTFKKEEGYLDYGGDYMLIKTDKNGKELWMKTYGHNIRQSPEKHIERYMEDYPFSIIETGKGYVISGYTFIKEDGKPSIYLVKTDKDGNKAFDQLYGTEESCFGGPMIKTGEDSFILLTNTWNLKNTDIILMKIALK